jgi:hypothetical protein
MKTNGLRIILLRIVLLILLSLYFLLVFGQPDYTFNTGTLISGTDKQTGAVYHYTNVRSGIDATVTIKDISAGITVTDIDAGSGYMEALQPTLEAAPYTNGYLEMYFELFDAGTFNPHMALEVPATAIDVDGYTDNDGLGNPLYEFDEIDLGGGYVDFSTLGGELFISQFGTMFRGINVAGIDYPGRDTAAKQVMFTVVNNNISSFTIRVGVDNQSAVTSIRLRSVYFKKFIYPNSVLSSTDLLFFKGNSRSDKINLDWSMAASNKVSKMELQRSNTGNGFTTIGTFLTEAGSVSKTNFSYADFQTGPVVYYRLRLTGASGKTEYSNILLFRKSGIQAENKMKVYPTVVKGGQFSVAITAEAKQESRLRIVDYAGRVVYQKKIQLEQGNNALLINDFPGSLRGNYMVAVKTNRKTESSAIIVH